MFDFLFFTGLDSDINHCLVVAKVMKKLLGSTRETQNFGTNRSSLELNEVKITKQYKVRVSNRFTVFGELRLKRRYK
jgi:hypothetical protein